MLCKINTIVKDVRESLPQDKRIAFSRMLAVVSNMFTIGYDMSTKKATNSITTISSQINILINSINNSFFYIDIIYNMYINIKILITIRNNITDINAISTGIISFKLDSVFNFFFIKTNICLLYTSPSPRD